MFLSFFNKPKVPARNVLEDALGDLGGSELVPIGLKYFDNYQVFTDEVLEAGYDVNWYAEDRVPTKAEVAFEVMFYLLSQNGYLANIDWATGIEGIIEEFNGLLKLGNHNLISNIEEDQLKDKAKDCDRGKAFMVVFDLLRKIMKERGLEIAYFDMGWDAHLPIFLSPEIYNKWIKIKFDKNYPVIP